MRQTQNIVKYFIGLAVVIGLRLIPHPPNVEPIMTSMMPFAKRWGWSAGLVFSIIAILSFDILTGTLGVWSLVTAGSYGLLGLLAGLYLRHKNNNIAHYVGFAIVGTILYDAITGIGIGMVFFHQPFWLTFTGQIPFTLMHLAGNVVLAAVVSPALYKWVVKNPNLETAYIWNCFKLAVK